MLIRKPFRVPTRRQRSYHPSLEQLETRLAPANTFPQISLISPETGTSTFSSAVTAHALSSGNIVVTEPGFNNNEGAVYLFNGSSGARISTLQGSSPGDQVGSGGITELNNGNFVVSSPDWNGNQGAATWESGTAGINGTVSAANSLVGSTTRDQVGSKGVTALTNGNYVVSSPHWNGNLGAASWGNGSSGSSGPVSAANSLVGSTAGDRVGSGGATALTNGNYVVITPLLTSGAGAATWGNGNSGITGTVSVANSLVGSSADFVVAVGAVTALNNGNYVVTSGDGNGGLIAATWGNGSSGTFGMISAANSLVDSNSPGSMEKVTALTNGNYVVYNPSWSGGRGAATWGNGSSGVSGTISAANSLVGTTPTSGSSQPQFTKYGDQVGTNVIALTNGSYVVGSPSWSDGMGAATWGNGISGITGTVSAANSLVGSSANDGVGGGVTALTNGNYVVVSVIWNAWLGAVTWGNGTTGITGTVSAANSLVGTTAGDIVGSGPDGVGGGGVTALTNGNYVVVSPFWQSLGATTWGNGTSGTTGTVSAANSIVGSSTGDQVGSGGVTALTNGNYVVLSPLWNQDLYHQSMGAATWGNGTTGITGTISAANSLVGSTFGDFVSRFGVTALTNGNYVVASANWNGGRGAATWGNGSSGSSGIVSAANSLVGSTSGDFVSLGDVQANPFVQFLPDGNVVALPDGNYVVTSPDWNNSQGAATWANGATGITLDAQNTPDAANSILGAVKGGTSQGPTRGSFIVNPPNMFIVGVPLRWTPLPPHVYVTAADAGGQPKVQVFDATSGAAIDDFFAYPAGFSAGVRVAAADLQGDGTPDIIVAPGPGGGSIIQVFDGRTGQMRLQFAAFANGNNLFTGGSYVAAGDILGQGYDDIIVSADAGGGPAVAVFDGKTGQQVMFFFAFSTSASGAVFTGGVRVAAGTYTSGGAAVIYTAAGPGGGPAVSVWSAADIAANQPEKTFYVLPPDANGNLFTGGVYLGATLVSSLGRDYLVTGAAAGGGPAVTLIDPFQTTGAIGVFVGQPFFAYDPSFTGGVRVAGGTDVLFVGPGPGTAAIAKSFTLSGTLLATFSGSDLDNPNFTGGLFVAAA